METNQHQVLETLMLELNTVRKNAKVYKQLPNSNICFLSDVGTLKVETKKKLDELNSKNVKAMQERSCNKDANHHN
ncbi:hypothetical protein JTE90_027785 [Oedothorax gibbosus]|uniref:Uncharacterized protein n=1 Tax=Oedothorax gibbosus TaxID=931172 RepID=A0AAV6V6M5_9ARAC|nr:hypothetical protein JTE90_027785 [Oedothorax gibbosus]